MNDSILIDLRSMRDRLRQKLEASSDFVEWQAVDTAIRQIEASRAPPTGIHPPTVHQGSNGSPMAGGRMSQTDYAILAVTTKGRPLSTASLIPEIEKLGGTVGGKEPITNLSSVLSKSVRVESVTWNGSKGWWPKGHPLPEIPRPGSAASG